MEQLESSGLLTEGEEQPQPQLAAASSAAASAPATSTSGANAVVEEAAGGADGGGGEPAEAEQKVLGYLKQAPSWSKVLDTGGGSIYYWNLKSNEVVWEVPEGADADDLLPPEGEAERGEAVGAEGRGGGGAPEPEGKQGEGVPSASVADAHVLEGVASPSGSSPESADLEEGQLPPEPAETAPEAAPVAAEAAVAEDSASALSALLLTQPQAHVAAVLESLEADASEAAAGLMRALPSAVRLAVEAGVRLGDWRELSAAQQVAVEEGRPEEGLCWEVYELHVSRKVRRSVRAWMFFTHAYLMFALLTVRSSVHRPMLDVLCSPLKLTTEAWCLVLRLTFLMTSSTCGVLYRAHIIASPLPGHGRPGRPTCRPQGGQGAADPGRSGSEGGSHCCQARPAHSGRLCLSSRVARLLAGFGVWWWSAFELRLCPGLWRPRADVRLAPPACIPIRCCIRGCLLAARLL